jgi:hypothetical protein
VDFGGYQVNLGADQDAGLTEFGSTGTGDSKIYGNATYYPFSVPGIIITKNISSFTVSADGLAEQSNPFSRGLFIVPSLTSSDGQNVNVTIAVPQAQFDAVPSGLSLSVTAPIPQPLTLGPQLVQGTATWTSESIIKSEFVLWKGTYNVGQQVTGAISLRLEQGGQVLDTLLIDAGVAGW